MLGFLRKFGPVIALLAPVFPLGGCAGGLQLTEVQRSSEKPSNVAIYFRVEKGDGDPVPGLQAEQFRIYEDDELVSVYESKQTILNPEVAASHYTLLLIDMSGSVAESEDAAKVVEAANVFATRVEKNNKVAIYAFDGEADLHRITGFTGSAGSAEARLSSLQSFRSKDPSTNLNGAVVQALGELDTALEKAENPLRFGTLVVFTDGTDRASRVSDQEMEEAVQDTNYEVFAIGLGAEMSEDQLARVGKNGTALAVDREAVVDAFDNIAARIEGITKSYYLLSYCSPARAGEHEVRIEAVVTEKDDKGREKERSGSLASGFDAEGFETGCDPSRAPKFDVTQGDAVKAEDEKKGGAKASAGGKTGS